jgi:uncharacterized protein (UPF0248 family)
MLTSHALLLQLLHDARYQFSETTICYRDRGAPDDCTCIAGVQVASLQPYYLEVACPGGMKAIPYHRIRRISYRGQVLWRKPARNSQES